VNNRVTISRLIIEALTAGHHVSVPELGTFVMESDPAQQKEVDGRTVWSAPKKRVDLIPDSGARGE